MNNEPKKKPYNRMVISQAISDEQVREFVTLADTHLKNVALAQ